MELKECIPLEMNPPINTRLVTDIEGLSLVKDFLTRVNVFGLDTETNVVPTFYHRKIRTIQVGDRNEQYVIDLLAFAGDSSALQGGQGSYTPQSWSQPVIDVLKPALESNSHLKVGVNLQFDYEVLKWCLGLRMWNLYDCFLAEKVLYAGKVHFMAAGFWAMDDMVARYCGLKISKDEQKGFSLDQPLTESQVTYAGLDTRFPLAIKAGQAPSIQRLGLGKAVEIENNAVPATGDRHLTGLLVDSEEWTRQVNLVKDEHKARVEVLDKHFISLVGEKEHSSDDLISLEQAWREAKDKEERAKARKVFYEARRRSKEIAKNYDSYEGQAAINYASAPQLKKVLIESGYKIANTDDKTLNKLAGDPLIDALRDYRETDKTLAMYSHFLEDFIDPDTGRVHPNFNQLGAATGRESCSKPNVLNINKESNWRSCFVAPKGKVILTIDYDGQELRIIAENSQEQLWIDAFNKGWDVHSVGAEMMFGQKWKDAAEEGCAYYAAHQKCKCKLHKVLRDQIKTVNFGIAYGAEATNLSEQLGISREEAQQLLDNYRQTFAFVTKYLRESGQYAVANLMAKTKSGRIRFFTKPTFETSKQFTIERFKKQGKPESAVTSKDVTRTYNSLYGNIEREGKNSPIQGCLTGNTFILEKTRGYCTIESLCGEEVEVWDGEVWSKAYVAASGKKQLVKMQLNGGNYIECSPDHLFWVKGTSGKGVWKKPSEITKQQRVILGNPVGEWSLPLCIPEIIKPNAPNSRSVGLQNFSGSAYQLGAWLGRLAGDGCISKKGDIIQFVAEDEEDILDLVLNLSKAFGIPVNHSVRQNQLQPKRFHMLRMTSMSLSRQLEHVGIKSKIPSVVWKDSSMMKGYLMGLFDADGSVSNDNAVLCFGDAVKNIAWAREVQQALLLLGIRARISTWFCPKSSSIHLSVLKRDMPLFSQTVGFLNSMKQFKADFVVASDKYPTVSSIYGVGSCVKTLEFTDEYVEMYDVVDSETSRFMANGMVVHNSGADIIKTVGGCGVDKNGIPFLWHTLEPKFGARIINSVYDELVIEADEDNAEEVLKFVEDAMARAGAEFVSSVVMKADGKINTMWNKG